MISGFALKVDIHDIVHVYSHHLFCTMWITNITRLKVKFPGCPKCRTCGISSTCSVLDRAKCPDFRTFSSIHYQTGGG